MLAPGCCPLNHLADHPDMDVVSPAATTEYIDVRIEPREFAMLRSQFHGIALLGRDASYMPQIVVDGAHHVVGSRESAVRGAVAAAASRP